ncbi:MAG: hypothetical protein IPN23_07655 [Elusimicrobia bacterium]|nr:hypothetical protein [Elusimicrobiota bacterium]
MKIRINYPVRVGGFPYVNTVPFRLDSRWNITPCPSPPFDPVGGGRPGGRRKSFPP